MFKIVWIKFLREMKILFNYLINKEDFKPNKAFEKVESFFKYSYVLLPLLFLQFSIIIEARCMIPILFLL